MTTASILFVAMLLDAVFGEPAWLWSRLPHPAVLMGRVIGWCDTKLNTGPRRRVKGIALAIALALGAVLIGGALSLFGPIVEGIVAAILLAQKSLVQHVSAVASALRQSLAQGRQSVALIVSRDTTGMTESEVARSAIESAAENLSDGVIAPAVWFLVAGLPGVIAYKWINTADSMIGYRTPRHERFGWACARLDDLLNLVPARLTCLMLAAVGGVRDWRAVRIDARRHKSPNAGWPEAAMSRALGIALAGPRTYDGQKQDLPWVNAEGRKNLTPDDIDAAVKMLWNAWGVMLGLTGSIALLSLIFGR